MITPGTNKSRLTAFVTLDSRFFFLSFFTSNIGLVNDDVHISSATTKQLCVNKRMNANDANQPLPWILPCFHFLLHSLVDGMAGNCSRPSHSLLCLCYSSDYLPLVIQPEKNYYRRRCRCLCSSTEINIV